MLKYEVDSWADEKTEEIMIRVKTTDRGHKEGFTIRMTDEWIQKNLIKTCEGEVYAQIFRLDTTKA